MEVDEVGEVDKAGEVDWELQRARRWLEDRQGRAKRRGVAFPEPEPPRESEGRADWEWREAMWRRGLEDEAEFWWIHGVITRGGLDVRLRVGGIPFEGMGDAEIIECFQDSSHEFWTLDEFNLLKVDLELGPLWTEFVASDFVAPDGHHPRISLCYRNEMWRWYGGLWQSDGAAVAGAAVVRWVRAWTRMRRRYDGAEARLRGRLSGGLTLQLVAGTTVEGGRGPLWDGHEQGGQGVSGDFDLDVHFVHTLPGNRFAQHVAAGEPSSRFKALQHMRVSLLLG